MVRYMGNVYPQTGMSFIIIYQVTLKVSCTLCLRPELPFRRRPLLKYRILLGSVPCAWSLPWYVGDVPSCKMLNYFEELNSPCLALYIVNT